MVDINYPNVCYLAILLYIIVNLTMQANSFADNKNNDLKHVRPELFDQFRDGDVRKLTPSLCIGMITSISSMFHFRQKI